MLHRRVALFLIFLILLLPVPPHARGQASRPATAPAAAAKGGYAPLPVAPAGFALRQLATMPKPPTRLTSDGSGRFLYVLVDDGDVFRIDLPDGQPRLIVDRKRYIVSPRGGQCIGLTLDRDGRLYVVSNEFDTDARPQMNHVRIYRSTARTRDGDPAELKPWLETQIPYAVDVFQHGVCAIAQGPDGFIYVGSGSRTDHGEAGDDPTRYRGGEVETSACMWRLDPKSEKPQIEVFARGLRNPFGFCFDDKGRLFATENGPNAHPPEEINLIEQGKHYGFPYAFSDWTSKTYRDQPDVPAGATKFELPIQNVGPAGGASADKPLGTLEPHSSPSGIVHLAGPEWPGEAQGTFLVARFGNMLPLTKDVGFDVVQVKLIDPARDGRLRAEVKPFLAPIARPTDLHMSGKGKIYICELYRETRNGGEQRPGRILELSSVKTRGKFAP